MNEDDLILSELCQDYEENGKSVNVEIYSGGDGQWILEIINDKGTSFVIEETFESDQAAWDAFMEEVKAKGIDHYTED